MVRGLFCRIPYDINSGKKNHLSSIELEGCCFSPGWVEGIRLSDGERGWFPKTYIEEITSRSARLRNLRENIRIKCVTQKLKGDH